MAKPRTKVKVERLHFTEAELQRARERAAEEFKNLLVWPDNPMAKKKNTNKGRASK